MKRGDICFVNLNKDKDSENMQVRPAVIIQNDKSNKSGASTIVAAITSNLYIEEDVAHVVIEKDCLKSPSIILLNQIKTIEKDRIIGIIGELSEEELNLMDQTLAASIGL